MTSSQHTPAQNDGADRPRRRATRPAAAPGATGASPAFRGSPAAAAPAGDGEGASRRRRGGRGRGTGPRPEGQQPAPRTPARADEQVPVARVVPVGDEATVVAADTTFAALGVPADLVACLARRGITEPFAVQSLVRSA